VASSSPSRVLSRCALRSGINVINKSKTFPRRQIHSARISTLLLSKLTSVTAGKLTAKKHVSNIHRCKEKGKRPMGDKIMKEETVQTYCRVASSNNHQSKGYRVKKKEHKVK
jgi:hypothetical protein